MDVTQIALTWVGWLNGEKIACKFDLDQSEHKSTQGLAKRRSRKQTQVLNLRLLASPFGQGL